MELNLRAGPWIGCAYSRRVFIEKVNAETQEKRRFPVWLTGIKLRHKKGPEFRFNLHRNTWNDSRDRDKGSALLPRHLSTAEVLAEIARIMGPDTARQLVSAVTL